jgi:hypothetical protein
MAREIVTSENREEFMEKKMAKMKKKPMSKEDLDRKERAKKMDSEQYERARKHPKFEMLRSKLGRKGAMDAVLNQMNMGDSETSLPK